MANENRQYKDSVFCDLFYNDPDAKENLLELYNALYDTHFTDPEIIKLVRLEDVLFKNFKNDVSFTANDEHIVLSEHQSTINPNMPLRSLMYIGREYESSVPVKSRYQQKLVLIPTPSFYVFYNGSKDYPLEQELLLSDAFIKPEKEPSLELKVKVININPDKKHEILDKCKILKEYSEFVEVTREHKKDKVTLEDAIRECIRKDILKDYLERKSGEVVNMLMAEYDYNMDIAVQREEAWQDGVALGLLKHTVNQIIRKLQKKYSLSKIAEDIEEPVEYVHSLIEVIEKYEPEYNIEKILDEILNQNSSVTEHK